MPDKVLDQQRLNQLDSNIKKMIDLGASQDDVMKYASDFKQKYSSEKPAIPEAPKPATGIPSFAEQQQQLSAYQKTKYEKAMEVDRERNKRIIADVYDSMVKNTPVVPGAGGGKYILGMIDQAGSALEGVQYIADEAMMYVAGLMSGKLLTAEEKAAQRAVLEAQREVGLAPRLAPPKLTPTEYRERIASNMDLTDGIGVDDLKALGFIGSRVAGDIGLAVAAGGAGVPMTATYFTQAYGDGLKEYDNGISKGEFPNNELARQSYAVILGKVNSILEKYGFDKIFGIGPAFKSIKNRVTVNLLNNTVKSGGKTTLETLTKAGDDLIRKELKGGLPIAKKTAFAAGVEFITEGGQSSLENAAKLMANAIQGQEIFNEDDIKNNFWKNVANDAIAGGILGGGMGSVSMISPDVNNTILNDIAAAKTEEDINNIALELQDAMDKNNIPQQQRELILNNIRRFRDIKQSIPQDLPENKQSEIISLIDRRYQLDNQITQSKQSTSTMDEAFKTDAESDLKILEEGRSLINDQIKEVTSDNKFKYFEQEGKYFKQFGEDTPEEISQSYYNLANIKQQEDATTKSQEPIQEGRTEGGIGQREGTQEGRPQKETTKTDIGYRYIVSEEGEEVPVAALLNKKVRINGEPAVLYQEGQRVVARVLGTNRVLDTFGSITEMADAAPSQFGIEVDDTLVTETPTGYRVEGVELNNTNANPLDAISYDQNGNVMNVALTTTAGKRRKFRGQAAQDLAYQITLKEALKNEEQFEQFLQQEYEQEIENARLQATAQEQAAATVEPVPTTPTVTVEPAYGRITEGQRIEPTVRGKVADKVVKDAYRVVTSITDVVRGNTGKAPVVNLHNQETFNQAVLEAGGTQEDSSGRGFYLSSDGTIHINLDNVASDTALHEGFHPILDFLEKNNPEIINDLFAELESIPEAQQIIEKARQLYEGDVTQKKEAITDFVAGVADGRVVVNPSNFQKIKAFIIGMLNKIGIGGDVPMLMNVNTEQDLIKLANFITEKFKTGETITFEGLKTIVGDDTADPVTVSNIAVVDPIQFQLVKKQDGVFKPLNIGWTPKGINMVIPSERSSLFDVVSKSGGAVVVINSDATGIGMKKGVLRQGGIGYTFIEQNIQDNIGFAASMDSKQTAFFKAVQEASRIRDEKFPDMAGKPVAVFVMVQAPEVMFGNAYGADYFIKSLAYALSHNEISTESAKADIVDYFNSIKETNDTGRKYANSIDALINLIQTSNLKSSKDRKKIYDLLITNRENNEDKSAKFGFDARRVLFGQFFNKVGSAKNKPGGRLRDILDNDGYNHKNFYNTFGDENVIKSLEGRTEGMKLGDGGFTMTGFFVDPTMSEQQFVERSKSGKFQHKQFNGKFYGTNPFVLNGKYYVNEVFPEARFVDKNGNPVPVTTSTAGSMYARTKTEPQAIVERAKRISGIQAQRAPKTVTKKPTGTEAFLKEQVPTEKKGPQFQKKRPVGQVQKKYLSDKMQEYFRFGLLGKENIKLEEMMGGEVTAEVGRAENSISEATALMEKYRTVVSKSDVSKFLTGKMMSTELPDDLASALSSMRGHIDALTDRLIELGVVNTAVKVDALSWSKKDGKYSFVAKSIEEQEDGTEKEEVLFEYDNLEKERLDEVLGEGISNRIEEDENAEGEIKEKNLVVDYYKANKGSYMLRSYSAVDFKDTPMLELLYGKGLNIDNVTKKLDNVDQTVVDAALGHLAKQAKEDNPELTDEEAMNIAEVQANKLLSQAEENIMQKGLTGSTNVRSLAQRKDIAPEIRALMGEYSDPIYNYYATIFKISTLTASRQYLISLKKYGMGKFFFNAPTIDATQKVAAEGTEALAPLNGLYTRPEIYEALQNSNEQQKFLAFEIMGRIRKYKTVYNPATHVKNLIGNMGFAVSNGHWNYLPESYQYIKAQISGGKSKDVIQLMDTLNRYGILNTSVGIGELRSYFDRNKSMNDFLQEIYAKGDVVSKGAKIKAQLAKIPRAMEKAYAAEDNMFKILAFVNESNRYSKVFYKKNYNELTAQEKKSINEKVSEIVKDTYPTFSRVPKVVKTFSKYMFMGNFLSFPVESIRVSYNTLALAMKEIKSKNPKLATIGATRLAGTVAYNSIFSALVYYGYNLVGAGFTGLFGYLMRDDEEEKDKANAILKNTVPWSRQNDLYVSKFDNGKLEYYDIGSLDSYSYQKKVWNAFWSNVNNKQGFDKAISESMGEALEPWFQIDFTIKNTMNLLSNDDGRGNNIYNPKASPLKKFTDMSVYVGKQMAPGAIGAGIKIADYYEKGEYQKAKDEFYSQMFARKYSTDLEKQFQNYIYAKYSDQNKEVGFINNLRDASGIYRRAKRDGLKGEALENAYQEALTKYKEVLKTANDYYNYAIRGGANPDTLRDMLKRSRIGTYEVKAITKNYYTTKDKEYIPRD